MRKETGKGDQDAAAYYDRRGVVDEIEAGPVEFALTEELRDQVLRGLRGRRLVNVSLRLDRVQIQALRKIATMKSIPYQTLIRHWLSEGLRRELGLAGKRRGARRKTRPPRERPAHVAER